MVNPWVMTAAFRPDNRRAKAVERTQKTERRARRVVEIWSESPALPRHEMHDTIRREFKCGHGAADAAISRAYEIYAANSRELGLTDRLAQHYWDIAEEAKRHKDFRGAVKALDSLRAHLGVGAPERIQLVDKDAEDVEELSMAQLELLAEIDRRRAAAAEADADDEAPPSEH